MKNKQWHGGKGSRPRPVDRDKFNESFDRIFRQKNDRQIKHDEKVFNHIKPSASQEHHSKD